MANIASYITEEDKQKLITNVVDLVKVNLENADSPQELVEAVEQDTRKRELSGSDEGSVFSEEEHEAFIEVAKKSCNPTYSDGTEKPKEEFDAEVEAEVEILENKKSEIPYRGSAAKVADTQAINKSIEEQKLFEDVWASCEREAKRIESQAIIEYKAKAIQKKWTDLPTDYKSGCYTNSDGQKIDIKVERQPVDWGRQLSENKEPTNLSIERLRGLITQSIKKKYGDWNRIKSIVVRSGQLIINDSMFVPVIEKKYINSDVFPVDTLDYIQNGCIAELFNWKALTKMTNLYSLDIDDTNFYHTTVGGFLRGRRVGVITMFNVCPRLEIFTLGSETTTRESLLTEESIPIKEKESLVKRFCNFSDGYKLNICKGTNGLQDFTLNNLKNYATNRGNKGLFRYCLGTMARVTLFAGAGVANLASHIVWGIKNIFADGTTPAEEV